MKNRGPGSALVDSVGVIEAAKTDVAAGVQMTPLFRQQGKHRFVGCYDYLLGHTIVDKVDYRCLERLHRPRPSGWNAAPSPLRRHEKISLSAEIHAVVFPRFPIAWVYAKQPVCRPFCTSMDCAS